MGDVSAWLRASVKTLSIMVEPDVGYEGLVVEGMEGRVSCSQVSITDDEGSWRKGPWLYGSRGGREPVSAHGTFRHKCEGGGAMWGSEAGADFPFRSPSQALTRKAAAPQAFFRIASRLIGSFAWTAGVGIGGVRPIMREQP